MMGKKKMAYGSKVKMMGGGGMPRKTMMGGGSRMSYNQGSYVSIHEMERDCAMKTSVRDNAKGYGSKVTIKVTT